MAPNVRRAIAATAPGPIDADTSFVEVETTLGPIQPRDLVVEVRAVSVNPVDIKVRKSFDAADAPKILGYDAAGVVVDAGSEVYRFSVGDEVYYAGAINRPGSNASHQLVNDHVVGHKPRSLSFAEAAALPLTTITAWEVLFDKLRLQRADGGTILVVAGAGGVGSMIIQLARQLTGLTIVATASRPESASWATELGAHHVVHPDRMREEVPALAPGGVEYVFSPYSAGNVETYAAIMAVYGQVVAIDEPHDLDTLPFKKKSQTWHWEYMFARPLYLPDDGRQRKLLEQVSELVDNGAIRTTATTVLPGLTPDTVRQAHQQVESGSTIGKVVIDCRPEAG